MRKTHWWECSSNTYAFGSPRSAFVGKTLLNAARADCNAGDTAAKSPNPWDGCSDSSPERLSSSDLGDLYAESGQT